MKYDSHIEKKTIITYLYQKKMFLHAFCRRSRGTTAALTTTWRSETAPWRRAP